MGVKLDVRHLRTFGCTAYSHINSSLRTSLDTTAEKGIFLGYAQYSKGFVFMRESDKKVFVRRDLEINESTIPKPLKSNEENEDHDPMEVDNEQYSSYHAMNKNIPQNFKELLDSPESKNWLDAAKQR